MGQASSQAINDQPPTLSKTANLLPTPSATPVSTNTSYTAQPQPGTTTNSTPNASPLKSTGTNIKSTKSKRSAKSGDTRLGAKTEPASTAPKTMKGIPKPEGKSAKKLRQAKLEKSVRNGLDHVSKNDFLSALNGGIKPEELARPRPATSKKARQTTPPRNATNIEDPVSSPSSLIDYEKTRKRRVSGSQNGPDSAGEGSKPKKRKTTAKKPTAPTSSSDVVHAKSLSKTSVTPRPLPKVDSKTSATSSASALRLAAATSLESFLIPIPTRTQPPSLRIVAQTTGNNNHNDAQRRQDVARNYAKGIGKVTRKRTDRSMDEIKSSGGPFTQQELDLAYKFRDDFCEEHDLTVGAFNNLVHAESRNGGLTKIAWTEYKELFPYRSAYSLRKIMRRQFDPYEHRVGWTKEEDEQLREAVELYERKWPKIGPAVGRNPEVCRDRWRNYLQYDKMKMERWNAAEVSSLRMAVGILMLKVWRARYEEAPPGSKECDVVISNDECRKLIHWHAVSKLVPQRSRLQCMQKWLMMEQAGQADYQVEITRARQREAGKADEESQSYEVEQLEWLLAGDKLKLCKAIKGLQAKIEADLDWKKIRASDPKLKIFTPERLRENWQQLRVEHLTEDEIADEDVGVSDAARKVKRRLRRATPKDKRKEYWVKYSKAEKPTAYKSSEFVHESDTSEEE